MDAQVKGTRIAADSEKSKALQAALAQIDKQFGKGTIMDTDASLVEINPLNRDSKGNIIALDAKFNFDSNALFRHPEIVALRDLDEEDAAEVEASKFDLAYISLDGNIGCLVNGAGLAMATMKGTNEDLGKKMLAESGLPIISADTMAEAAQKVVAAVKA